MKKKKTCIITITVRGCEKKPIMRTLCGDTLFLYLNEGESATWTSKVKVKK